MGIYRKIKHSIKTLGNFEPFPPIHQRNALLSYVRTIYQEPQNQLLQLHRLRLVLGGSQF